MPVVFIHTKYVIEKENYSSDKVRGTNEALGAPQTIVQVRAMALQFGGEASVHHGIAATPTEEIRHHGCRRRGGSMAHFLGRYRVWLRMLGNIVFGNRNKYYVFILTDFDTKLIK